MKRLSMLLTAALVATTIMLGITGCEDGGGDSSTSVDVSGTWNGSSIGDDPVNSDPDITMILTQSGRVLTGTVDGVPLSGTVNGTDVVATFPGGEGDTVTMSGTVNGNTMTGTWESSTGEKGTWTATKS